MNLIRKIRKIFSHSSPYENIDFTKDFTKLSKYFSWKLPNSEKINISDFIKILNNIDIKWDYLNKYSHKFWAIKSDYDDLFIDISNSYNWDNKIYKILKYFELNKSFLKIIDYSKKSEV